LTGDVADPGLMCQALDGADGCFHLAAIASVARANADWLGTHRTNQTGTLAVLDAARRVGAIPVVYASSAAVYGDQGDQPVSEDATPRPRSAYGADKLGSELHAAVAFGVHGVPTLGLRFFNVYGPRQDPTSAYSGVISIFAARVAAGLPVVVNGDGQQTRDFIYIDDVIRHLLGAMARLRETPAASVLNVCTGGATSVLELAHALGAATGRLPKIQHAPACAGDIRNSRGDPARAAAALGVTSAVTLADGLPRLLAWQRTAALSLVA
jgi:UDP-glucose 4-epimerase